MLQNNFLQILIRAFGLTIFPWDINPTEKCNRSTPKVTVSLKRDRENQWVKVTEEVEVTLASDNTQRLFGFIRDTSGREAFVSEIVCGGNREPVQIKQQTLEHWTEHFYEQFSLPHANVLSLTPATANSLKMFLNSPKKSGNEGKYSTSEECKCCRSRRSPSSWVERPPKSIYFLAPWRAYSTVVGLVTSCTHFQEVYTQ